MEQTGWRKVADLHLRRRDKAPPCLVDLRWRSGAPAGRLHMEASMKGCTMILKAEALRHAPLMGRGGSHDQPVHPENTVNMSECNRISRHSHIFGFS